jgi:hypothetical protein
MECWGSLKHDIRRRYDEHAHQVSPLECSAIEGVIESDDPQTLWTLADLEGDIITANGRTLPIGKVMLLGLHWEGFFNLGDDEAMDRFRDYLTDKDLL